MDTATVDGLVASMAAVTPELTLAVGGMVLLMFGVVRGDQGTPLLSNLCVLLLLLAGGLVLTLPVGDEAIQAFNSSFAVDRFAVFMKVLVLTGAALALIMSRHFMQAENLARFEYPLLMVLATLGMLIMISAQDLITLYVGLELQSLSLYVLAAINRDSLRATEAGLKYFVLGALSSGMLLYGASFVYGFSGTTNFLELASGLEGSGLNLGIVVGLVFVAAGLAFKVSAVPFHMWTPDVYEGAPTPVTAFFAAAPKIAAMALFLRTFLVAFGEVADAWREIIIFLSVGSMLLGAFAAIGQRNLKRLMAYSSIGNMGYALMGLAAGTQAGIEGVLIYLVFYMTMTVGVFVCILSMRRPEGMVERIEDLAGLSKTHPFMAYTLMVLMFSLIGVPPLAGFFGKWYVFLSAVQADLVPLAVVGVLTSAVAAFYYLRIVKVMFMDEPVVPFQRPVPLEMHAILTASGAVTLFYALYPGPLLVAAAAAARSLLAG
ncbi:MAG: NADH-quinone oxidoreductase subunit NuoN [Alphaproteobacteria bacterium]